MQAHPSSKQATTPVKLSFTHASTRPSTSRQACTHTAINNKAMSSAIADCKVIMQKHARQFNVVSRTHGQFKVVPRANSTQAQVYRTLTPPASSLPVFLSPSDSHALIVEKQNKARFTTNPDAPARRLSQ
eukprot:1742059-Amphidinium_carterae.2